MHKSLIKYDNLKILADLANVVVPYELLLLFLTKIVYNLDIPNIHKKCVSMDFHLLQTL